MERSSSGSQIPRMRLNHKPTGGATKPRPLHLKGIRLCFTTTMNHFPTNELITLIDAMYDAGCDPAFDAVYDDLEREFAERRMHNSNA